MAKDTPQEMRLFDLTDDEIERIEGLVFCMGGPPEELTATLLWKASLRHPGAPDFSRAA